MIGSAAPENVGTAAGSSTDRLRSTFARLAAITRRDFRIERSYRLRYPVRIVQIAIVMAILYHISELVTDAPELTEFGGSYFEFGLVGLAVMTVAQLGITTFNANIQREQSLGTLEILLSTPTSVSTWLTGSFAFPLALASLNVIGYIGVGLGVLGRGLDPLSLGLSSVVLVLTLLSFCAFGIVSAGLVVLAKRGDPIGGLVATATSMLSGALFPVSTLPLAFQWLAHAFPAFYGIRGLREVLLADAGISDVLFEIGMLVGFDLVMLPASILVMKRCLRASRRAGTLGNY